MSDVITVVLIGNSGLMLDGIRRIMQSPPFRIDACAHDVRSAAKETHEAVHLVVLASVAERDISDATRAFPDARIVVLGDEGDNQTVQRTLDAGACAFLLKNLSAESFMHALSMVAAEENIVLVPAGGRVAPRTAPSPSTQPRLSPREATILQFVKDGHSNKVIARKLDIAEATVKCHVKTLLRKINVRNRFEAAMWALRSERAQAEAVEEDDATAHRPPASFVGLSNVTPLRERGAG